MPPPPVAVRSTKNIQVVKAIYNYTAQNSNELSFEEGDILYVVDKSDPNWLKCQCGGKEGLVPGNYVGENTSTIENPVHEAAKRGNMPFLSELLSAGVSVNGLDKAGNTPLHWACRGNHEDAVKLLLTKSPSINVQNKLGDTPLHSAAWAGNQNIVKMLMQVKDIKLDLKNKDGQTPLKLAKNVEVAAVLSQTLGIGNNSLLVPDDDED